MLILNLESTGIILAQTKTQQILVQDSSTQVNSIVAKYRTLAKTAGHNTYKRIRRRI